MKTVGVLLAAGQSRRFGPENKLLAERGGKYLVRWAAEALCAAGCDDLGAVVSSPEVAAVLPPALRPLHIAPDQAMSVSFQRAVSFMQETDAGRLLICLGDMPNISSSLLRSLLARSGDAACCFQGLRMPPALLTRHQLANAAGMGAGDHGARRLLKHIPDCALIELTPSQATDIDRIEDLSSPSFCDPALLRENE